MALKPRICKLIIALSDIDKNYYDSLNLTVAQHPSETVERMMVRILAYCINAQENLEFTKGLSSVEEPDLWVKSLDDQLLLWIEVGEPTVERIKKATRLAQAVKVYSFNSKSAVWWEQGQEKFAHLQASMFQLPWESVQALAALHQRSMNMSVTISGDSAYFATDAGECEVPWSVLQSV